MFNWQLFLLLTAISLPGIMGTAPKFVLSIRTIARDKLPADKEPPSVAVLLVVLVVQNLLLGLLFAAVGTFVTPRIGFEAPVFTALLQGKQVWPIMQTQLVAIAGLGIGGAVVFLAVYYGWYRPRLDDTSVTAMEELRQKLGLRGRLLYGGVFEEVLARWGLMSLLVWLGKLLLGSVSAGLVWTAIIAAGVLFGLLHIPNYLAAGCRSSGEFFSLMIGLNLGAGLIFGWLFWQHSLAGAMLAHMLFHLIWYPVDQQFAATPNEE